MFFVGGDSNNLPRSTGQQRRRATLVNRMINNAREAQDKLARLASMETKYNSPEFFSKPLDQQEAFLITGIDYCYDICQFMQSKPSQCVTIGLDQDTASKTYIMWITKDEEKIVREIFSKDVKTKEDLALLGDIFSRINAQGDWKLG